MAGGPPAPTARSAAAAAARRRRRPAASATTGAAAAAAVAAVAGCARSPAGEPAAVPPVEPAARTSSSVTRPPGPLPFTARRSTPSSRASRRVDGAAGTGPSRGAAGAAVAACVARPLSATTVFGSGASVRVGSSVSAACLPLAAVASPKLTSTCPTFTVCPGRTWIFSTRPPIGDGISTVALSVSTSSSGASSPTISPSRTSTWRISASVSPSPRSGNTKSRGMEEARARLRRRACRERRPARGPDRGRWPSRGRSRGRGCPTTSRGRWALPATGRRRP